MDMISKFTHFAIVVFLLFVNSFSYSQSKKEQIEILSYQKDSLELLLKKNKDSYFNSLTELKIEKNNLLSKVNELKYKNDELVDENNDLKNQIASLNQKLDSISNLQPGIRLVPIINVEETNDDCINRYLFNSNTIELPRPSELMNTSFINILPVGWSAEGVFAYNWVSEDVCGTCSAGLDLFDAKNNTELPSFSYDLQEFGEDDNKRCEIVEQMKADLQNSFQYNNIVPVSSLKMNYINNTDGGLLIENRIFKIERSSGKGRLIMINQIGEKKILHEEVLKKVYNDYYLQWCEDDIQINGAFYNPLNNKQLIIHLYKIVPCGFEHEDEYSSFFISVNF